MRYCKLFVVFVGLVGAERGLAQLEVGGDLLGNCAEIDALQKAGDFTAARDKARLCLDGIEQELSGQVSSYFRPQIGDWKRTSLEESDALGFTNTQSTYEKGNIRVDVNLMGTSGGGGGGGLGGLGGLFGGVAQNALLQSGRQVTVAGIRSALQPDGTLVVPLEDGSMLTFESNDLDTADEALAGMGDLVNDFPVAEINAALK
jgi:hypothetical protein